VPQKVRKFLKNSRMGLDDGLKLLKLPLQDSKEQMNRAVKIDAFYSDQLKILIFHNFCSLHVKIGFHH